MTGVVQAIALVLLIGFAVIGALELDRRVAGCPAHGFELASNQPSPRP